MFFETMSANHVWECPKKGLGKGGGGKGDGGGRGGREREEKEQVRRWHRAAASRQWR